VPAPARPGRVLATVTFAQVLAVASTTVIAVALPALGRDLGADAAQRQWVVDAFVLVFASLLVAGGVFGDRRGRRTAFVLGLGLFTLGSLWCALAPNVELLLAGRVAQALGPPLVLPASLSIVTMVYPERAARARAIGLWAIGSGVGVAAGPLLGGVIVDVLGWRWVFGVNVPIALVAMAMALRVVPRDRPVRSEEPFDGAAAVLLTVALALLVFGLIEGRELGWGSAAVIAAFGGSALLAGAFAARERRHPAPLIDLALLRERSFLAANLGGISLYGALTGSAVYTSVFLQQVQGRSAIEAGLCLLPQGALTAIAGPLAGRLVARLGPRPPMLTGMALGCAAFVLLLRLEVDSSMVQVWLPFALLGLGIGLALPAMTVTALAAVPPTQTGMASAVHNASRQLGQTLSVAALGTIILGVAGDQAEGDRLAGAAADAWLHGLHTAMGVTAASLALAGVAIAVLLPRGRPAS
jgi:DHA2 family methylenomycin A resistance protein-like MFS transporter